MSAHVTELLRETGRYKGFFLNFCDRTTTSHVQGETLVFKRYFVPMHVTLRSVAKALSLAVLPTSQLGTSAPRE